VTVLPAFELNFFDIATGFRRFGLGLIEPDGLAGEAKRGGEPASVPGYFGPRRVEYFKRRFCISVTARPR